MKKEFKQILTDFGDTRRSNIVESEKAQALEEKDLMPSEKVTVTLSKAGWVRCAKGDNIDPKGLSYKPEDKPFLAISGNSNIKVIFFTKLGKAYSMYVDKFPSARGYGEHITTYIPLDRKDEIINMSFVNAAPYFLLASISGKGFIVTAEDLITNKITGKNIFDAEDVFKFIPIEEDSKMLGVSAQGRVIIRDFSSFALLKKGKGKSIIKLDKKDKLKYVELFSQQQELILNAGKRFIRIDNKNIETYYTDKPSGGGVLLPQGFRKITKIVIESK
jgi:topoisomerase-4 subunit A